MTEKAPKDIVERINEKCVGHPSARIAWPHRILHEAAAEITRLREALASTEVFTDKVGATCNQNADERDRLRAREAELVEALEPFAAEAPKWDAFDSNEPLVETWNEGPDTNLTVADLRSARAALKDTSS